MKTILDKFDRDELLSRIRSLTPGSRALWGRMNLYQMLKHCTLCEEMYQGKKEYRRMLLGRLIGKMALRGVLDENRPFQKNAPTNRGMIVKETGGDIEGEKSKWADLIRNYEHYNTEEYTHWFFGKMSRDQVGKLVYKHADHHLRQFDA